MTSLTIKSSLLPQSILTELLRRQRTLAIYGLVLLPLGFLTLLAQGVDPRTFDGVSVWVKPTKFFLSLSLFALTAAWFFGYIRPERRKALMLRFTAWILIFTSAGELAYISFQASQGQDSHFNLSTPFHAFMFDLMGQFAIVLISTTLPLAWEIARRPAAHIRPDFARAVVVGLVLSFLLGAGFGGYMGVQEGHSVGLKGGHVPFFGWNRSGGDLRIAHFLGIHAEQAIPLLAASAANLSAPLRSYIIWAGTALYIALAWALFAQAVAGRPLLAA